jgi:hypothetical protein
MVEPKLVQIRLWSLGETSGSAACCAERLRLSDGVPTNQPPPCRRKAQPSGGTEGEEKGRVGPEGQSPSAQQVAEPPRQSDATANLDSLGSNLALRLRYTLSVASSPLAHTLGTARRHIST